MRKTLLPLLLPFALTPAAAQTFSEHIRQSDEGKGRVILTQSARIEALVDNPAQPAKSTAAATPAAAARKTAAEPAASARPATAYTGAARQRYKARGFRIQIFTGGNSRNDKNNAARAGSRIHSAFPELSVYAHFISPRWVCRVGDFRSREDAEKYVALIRRSGLTQECHIVACTVLLAR